MAGQTKQDNQNFEHVKRDHYGHKLAMLAVAAYGWQLHGWLTAGGILVGLFVIIAITNTVLMANSPDHSVFRWVRVNRWFWVFLALIILMLSSATMVSA